MPNLIKIKRSSVPTKIPTTTDLELGELAVNTNDGKLFLKKDNGTQSIVEVGADITRVVSAPATSGTLTINSSTTEQYLAESLNGSTIFAAPSGTPSDGQKLIIRIKDSGSSVSLTWTTSAGGFRVVGVSLPTATTSGKLTYVGSIYNTSSSTWDVLAVTTEA